MQVGDVTQVASVLTILRVRYGVDTDYVFGPLRVRDYKVIVEGISEEWTAYAIAEKIAELNDWERTGD